MLPFSWLNGTSKVRVQPGTGYLDDRRKRQRKQRAHPRFCENRLEDTTITVQAHIISGCHLVGGPCIICTAPNICESIFL